MEHILSAFWSSRVIVLIGVVIRVVVGALTIESNDNYVEPVYLWLHNSSFPAYSDCWECFQPPFFFFVIRLIAICFQLTHFSELYWIVQSVNTFLSIGVLLLIFSTLRNSGLSGQLKNSLLLFWSLSPELISIGALGSSDMALIIVGFFLGRNVSLKFLNSNWYFNYTIILLLFLAGIIKGNGLVFVGAMFLLAWICIIRQNAMGFKWRLIELLRLNIVYLVLVLAIGISGGYVHKYLNYGDPFVINQVKPPAPPLVSVHSGEFNGRLGVRSVLDAYGTFRILDLLEHPNNVNTSYGFSVKRTSMMSQFYGQFNNIFFESHPPSWKSPGEAANNVGRLGYILMFPILIGGFVWFFWSGAKYFQHKVVLSLFILFVVRYSYVYRDFSTMKVMFIFPALYSLVVLSIHFVEEFRFKKIVPYLVILVSMCYFFNLLQLIDVLYKNSDSYMGIVSWWK